MGGGVAEDYVHMLRENTKAVPCRTRDAGTMVPMERTKFCLCGGTLRAVFP